MSAFLTSFSTAAKIGSPIALLAFIAVLIFWHRLRTLKKDLRELKALPPDARAEALQNRQNLYGLTAEVLSGRGALDLMISESNHRARNERHRLYVSAAAFVTCFVTVVIAGPWEENSRSTFRPPRPTARAGRAPQGNVQLALTFETAGIPGDARLEVEVAYGSNHDQAWDIQELQPFPGLYLRRRMAMFSVF